MTKQFYTFLLLFSFLTVNAQFTSPNTGVEWTLDSIAYHSPTTITVSGNEYTLMEDLIIQENDYLFLNKDLILKISPEVEIEVHGHFESDSDEIIITAVDPDQHYKGLRFTGTSYAYFNNTLVEYGGGIRAITPNFEMYNCEVSNNGAGSSTGGAISFSSGSPIIMNSTFKFNDRPALGSAANASVSAHIEGNYLEGNNQSNSNAPQINMGPSGPSDTIRIINNTVIGDRNLTKVGGISASSLVGVENLILIKGNTVRDNRYGITSMGNSSGIISNNIIEDNDTEGDPMMGGSGINLFSTVMVHVYENEMRRNLWGVTLQGTAFANFGSDDEEDNNPGLNIFSENGNGGVIYALYNNTPNSQKALHNCWIEGHEATIEDVEEVVFHLADDSTLGEVFYDPFECGEEEEMGLAELSKDVFQVYPNPARSSFNINSPSTAVLNIYDLNGRLIQTHKIASGKNNIQANLAQGIYLLEIQSTTSKSTQKLIIQ